MKIAILTIDDYLFLPVFFKVFLQARAKEVIRIIILTPKGYYRSLAKTLKNIIILYGLTGAMRLFILRIFKQIISLIAYIFKKPSLASSVEALARLYNIPCLKVSDIGDERAIRLLESVRPELIFSVSLPQIIPERLLSLSRYGIFNIHTSLLPKYRGVLPVFRALANGEERIGTTIHLINDKIDCGDIVAQESFQVEPDDTLETCMEKGKLLGAELALKVAGLIEKNQPLKTTRMDLAGTKYYSFPTRAEVVSFKNKRRLY